VVTWDSASGHGSGRPDNPILTKKDRDLFRRAVAQALQQRPTEALDALPVAAAMHVADDRAAFARAMQDVQPLKVDRAVPRSPRPSPRPLPPSPARQTSRQDGLPYYPRFDFGDEQVADQLWFARSGLQDRILRKLRRGKLTPEGEVDLHGLRASDAEAEVGALLREAKVRGARCVRIIHGKGYRSESQRAVLKGMVDRLLRSRDEVLAFSSAPPEQGGTGAVLVLLRR